ncbi:hypothetical protein [Sulfitobacter sp. M13]
MSLKTNQIARALLAGVAISVAGVPAFADALSSTFSFRIVEATEGEEALIERGTVRPGEVIQYQLQHENTTEQALAGIVIAAPVPEGVTLTLGAESTSIKAVFEVQADLDPENDGLEWSTLPATRMVAGTDGTLQPEPLPEDQIAAVRWTLSEPLESGEIALNSYRVRVN